MILAINIRTWSPFAANNSIRGFTMSKHRLSVVSAMLGVPYSRAYAQVMNGTVPAEHDAKGWLVSENDFEQLKAAVAAMPVRRARKSIAA